MKKVLTLSFILFSIAVFAQTNNAILFTENGERFKVVLNGILQNANPETNVKLTNLVANNYKCRILFEETTLGHFDFNLVFPNPGYEVTWNIKKNNKGEFVARYVSDVPVADAPPTPEAQKEVVFTSTPAVVTTTTTTIQSTHSTTDDANINVGINANDEGGSISIQTSGTDPNTSTSSYSTTTTTTTTKTVTTGGTVAGAGAAPGENKEYVPGYTGKCGCPKPVSDKEFMEIEQSIRSKDFENTKLTIAKQILKNNCLTSAQVKEVVSIFDFENTKLEYAKYAYSHTYDVGNYYKVNDEFEFENSVEELNRYIATK